MRDAARRAGLHPHAGLNARQAEQQALAEWREDRSRQEQEATKRAREAQMKQRKTSFGDRVDKFPEVDGLRDQVADVMEAMSDAFDEAEKTKAFENKLHGTRTVDTARFPAAGGGQ